MIKKRGNNRPILFDKQVNIHFTSEQVDLIDAAVRAEERNGIKIRRNDYLRAIILAVITNG